MKPKMRTPNHDVNSPKESLLDDFLLLSGALLVFLAILYLVLVGGLNMRSPS